MKLNTANKIRLISAVCCISLILAISSYADNPISDSAYYPGTQTETVSYIMFIEGSTYYAINGFTGEPDFSGSNATEIINDCITEVSGNGGGSIFFKPGDYVIDASLILKEKVRLQGELQGKPADPVARINSPVYTGVMFKNTFVFVDEGADLQNDIQLMDLDIQGNANSYAFNLTNVDMFWLERVRIRGFVNGLKVNYYGEDPPNHVSGVKINDCSFKGISGTPIHLNICGESWITNNRIGGGSPTNIEYGIVLNGSNKIQIYDNQIGGNFTQAGIKITDKGAYTKGIWAIQIHNNWIYTLQDAKYIEIDVTPLATTKRLHAVNNMFANSGADKPDKTDFPDGLDGCSFSGNVGAQSYSEQWGNATILNGQTTVTVSYNLLRNATGAIVTGGDNQNHYYYVDRLWLGTFRIHSNSAVGQNTTVYWFAWCYP